MSLRLNYVKRFFFWIIRKRLAASIPSFQGIYQTIYHLACLIYLTEMKTLCHFEIAANYQLFMMRNLVAVLKRFAVVRCKPFNDLVCSASGPSQFDRFAIAWIGNKRIACVSHWMERLAANPQQISIQSCIFDLSIKNVEKVRFFYHIHSYIVKTFTKSLWYQHQSGSIWESVCNKKKIHRRTEELICWKFIPNKETLNKESTSMTSCHLGWCASICLLDFFPITSSFFFSVFCASWKMLVSFLCERSISLWNFYKKSSIPIVLNFHLKFI